MARELAYVLINPYTIAKSRTGGVIARFTGRTDLNFVAACMFQPSRELVEEYARIVRTVDVPTDVAAHESNNLIADYVLQRYVPDPVSGRPRRVMMLLFEGEDAIAKVRRVTGNATLKPGSGESIRDTYGDYIVDTEGHIQYFEPAVLIAPTQKRAEAVLSLWARYASRESGFVAKATDVPEGGDIERTLVLLKPDNFRFPSFRPGSIVDLLSSAGLRIVAIKKFCMTVAQAEEFYGPVREALRRRFRDIGATRLAAAVEREFGLRMPDKMAGDVCDGLGPLFAEAQFNSIIRFMTGYNPAECSESDKSRMGSEACLALVYAGANAVQKIRNLIGATDPSKAPPGSVRREFGHDVMVNAIHASDSVENAQREIRIVNMDEETISPWVARYYGEGKNPGEAHVSV